MENSFFNRLVECMHKRQIWTQVQLSKITGIDNGTISRWKNEKITPRDDTILKLSKALECDAEYLKTGKLNAQKNMATANNHSMANAIVANGSGPIHINYGKQEGGEILLEVSERERALILMMRKHASPAMWERLENDLMEQEKRYG
jgi:transcriptional regulator with XRE-family HTH domain